MRKYLPTLGELIDRLSIVLLKQINIADRRGEYRDEAGVIMSDINLVLYEKAKAIGHRLTAVDVHAIIMLALSNREIWLNESMARRGGAENDHLLKFTHSINGVRNRAKNIISERTHERVDAKVDSYAANLPEEFGNWNVFG